MSELPGGWARTSFTDVVQSVSTTDHVVEANEYALDGSIRVLTQGVAELDGFTDDRSRAFDSYQTLIVFGDHTRVLKLGKPPFAVGPNAKVLAPSPALVSKFLYYQLQTILPQSRGYGRHYQFLAKSRLAIAPLAEQKRIVAAVEEQFSRLDAGVAELGQAQEKLQQLRASLVDEVIRLATESGAQLTPLANLIEPGRKISYGVLVPGEDIPGGVPLVRIGDLDKRQVKQAELKRIDPTIAASFPRTKLRGGEVLISLVGTIGRTAVAPKSLAGANTARAVGVMPFRADIDPEYIAIALSRKTVTRELTGLSHEVARKTLNLEDVRRYAIPVPSRDRQAAIVEWVQANELRIDRAEAEVRDQIVRAQHLRASILASAFSGQLVPQDPSDEPASKLLERTTPQGVSRISRKPTPRTPPSKVSA